MCGIVGIIGKAEVAPLLFDGLKRLEYRGYDSAGIATLIDGRIDRRRLHAGRRLGRHRERHALYNPPLRSPKILQNG